MTAKITDWQNKVEMMLSRLEDEGGVITYLEMAEHADIPSPHRIHQLTEFLESLISRDVRLGQVIIAARVVSKQNGLPADGFFEYLAQKEIMPKDGESRADFHKRLLCEAV